MTLEDTTGTASEQSDGTTTAEQLREATDMIRRTFPSDPALAEMLITSTAPENRAVLERHLATLWGAGSYPLWPEQNLRLLLESEQMLVTAEQHLRTVDLGDPQMRLAVPMIAELIVAAQDPTIVSHPDNWLWGPLGPPVQSPDPIDDTKSVFWSYAKATQQTWNKRLERDWVNRNNEYTSQLAEAAHQTVEASVAAVNKVFEVTANTREALEFGLDERELPRTHWNEPQMATIGQQMWEAVDELKACVDQMLIDAEACGVITALDNSKTHEEQALRVLAAKARPQVMRDWWNKNSPQPEGDTDHDQAISFWTRQANPIYFWEAVFLAAALESQYAASEDLQTVANFLTGNDLTATE